MKKIEHIGIAVKDISASNKLFTKLFGEQHYKVEEVESEGVKTSFFKIGENKIELLEATKENSPIAKFIEKRGEGIHHIAFDVENIEEEIKRLDLLSAQEDANIATKLAGLDLSTATGAQLASRDAEWAKNEAIKQAIATGASTAVKGV